MRRSVGITLSAVLVFVGSAFIVFLGAIVVLGALVMRNAPARPNVLQNIGYVEIVMAVFFFALGGWGIASGVGLIKVRQWARISMLTFAAILVLFCLPPGLMMAFIPLPVPKDSSLPSNFVTLMRVGMVSFYGALAALGGFWLYFFNRRNVKAQFSGNGPVMDGPLTSLAEDIPRPNLTPQPARPVSITIIGWFLLLSAPLSLLALLYTHALLPSVPMPVCIFGFFFFGRSASLIFAMWMLAQAVSAVGLLKLQNWGRVGTIGLQLLGAVNILLLAGIPANRARFQQIMEATTASMNAGTPQPVPFTFPAWMVMVSSFPIFCVILWFLITQKQPFTARPQEPIQRF